MPPPVTLPDGLGPAFAVSQARALGVKRSVIDHPVLERPFRGSRLLRPARDAGGAGADTTAPWEQELRSAQERMSALWPLVPDEAFFYGPSAALLWNAPLPLGAVQNVHVAVPFPRSAMHRPGVISTRMRPTWPRS